MQEQLGENLLKQQVEAAKAIIAVSSTEERNHIIEKIKTIGFVSQVKETRRINYVISDFFNYVPGRYYLQGISNEKEPATYERVLAGIEDGSINISKYDYGKGCSEHTVPTIINTPIGKKDYPSIWEEYEKKVQITEEDITEAIEKDDIVGVSILMKRFDAPVPIALEKLCQRMSVGAVKDKFFGRDFTQVSSLLLFRMQVSLLERILVNTEPTLDAWKILDNKERFKGMESDLARLNQIVTQKKESQFAFASHVLAASRKAQYAAQDL